jgi:hypothetical protein
MVDSRLVQPGHWLYEKIRADVLEDYRGEEEEEEE